jgi:hypothetical protein
MIELCVNVDELEFIVRLPTRPREGASNLEHEAEHNTC